MKPRFAYLALAIALVNCASPPPAAKPPTEGVVETERVIKPGGAGRSPGATPSGGSSNGSSWGSFRPIPVASGFLPQVNGSNAPLSQVDPLFDFDFRGATGIWSNKPRLNRARAGLQAGVVNGVLIAVEGDHRPSMEAFGRTELQSPSWILYDNYDEKGAPSNGDTLGYGLSLAASGIFNDKELWTAGGFRGDFNPDGGSGRTELLLYQMSDQKQGFAAGRTDGGSYNLSRPRRAAAGGVLEHTFVVAGGVYDATMGANARVDLVDLLRTGPDAVRTGPDLPTPVAGAASAVVGKRLFVLGGYDPRTPKTALKQVQIFDLDTQGWSTGAELPEGRHSGAATALNGVIYLVGGIGDGGAIKRTMWSLNTQRPDAAWERLPDMPTARALLALAAWAGELWAIGGIGDSRTVLSTVEGYRL